MSVIVISVVILLTIALVVYHKHKLTQKDAHATLPPPTMTYEEIKQRTIPFIPLDPSHIKNIPTL